MRPNTGATSDTPRYSQTPQIVLSLVRPSNIHWRKRGRRRRKLSNERSFLRFASRFSLPSPHDISYLSMEGRMELMPRSCSLWRGWQGTNNRTKRDFTADIRMRVNGPARIRRLRFWLGLFHSQNLPVYLNWLSSSRIRLSVVSQWNSSDRWIKSPVPSD